MTTDVINGVPRELLEQIEALLALLPEAKTIERVRALLATAQPVSDGGEREAFEAVYAGRCNFERNPHHPDIYAHEPCRARWDAWIARAALSPAGGGVVMPERHSRKDAFECGGVAQEQFVKGWNSCLDEVARLNAKPQANSQEGSK